MVSKDERELTQSRAELEALLTQQRSASAATVQSEPSTSSQNDSNKVLFLPLQLHLKLVSTHLGSFQRQIPLSSPI